MMLREGKKIESFGLSLGHVWALPLASTPVPSSTKQPPSAEYLLGTAHPWGHRADEELTRNLVSSPL
jgi:hypothetical protein